MPITKARNVAPVSKIVLQNLLATIDHVAKAIRSDVQAQIALQAIMIFKFFM